MSQAVTPAVAEVFVPLLVDEAEYPCQKVVVSAAVVAVTLNPLMVLVASQAAMKKLAVEERLLLESEPQAVLEESLISMRKSLTTVEERIVPVLQVLYWIAIYILTE